jgi:hypothetical protein
MASALAYTMSVRRATEPGTRERHGPLFAGMKRGAALPSMADSNRSWPTTAENIPSWTCVFGSRHLGFDSLHRAGTGAALTRCPENALAASQLCADRGLFRHVDPRPTDRACRSWCLSLEIAAPSRGNNRMPIPTRQSVDVICIIKSLLVPQLKRFICTTRSSLSVG